MNRKWWKDRIHKWTCMRYSWTDFFLTMTLQVLKLERLMDSAPWKCCKKFSLYILFRIVTVTVEKSRNAVIFSDCSSKQFQQYIVSYSCCLKSLAVYYDNFYINLLVNILYGTFLDWMYSFLFIPIFYGIILAFSCIHECIMYMNVAYWYRYATDNERILIIMLRVFFRIIKLLE